MRDFVENRIYLDIKNRRVIIFVAKYNYDNGVMYFFFDADTNQDYTYFEEEIDNIINF